MGMMAPFNRSGSKSTNGGTLIARSNTKGGGSAAGGGHCLKAGLLRLGALGTRPGSCATPMAVKPVQCVHGGGHANAQCLTAGRQQAGAWRTHGISLEQVPCVVAVHTRPHSVQTDTHGHTVHNTRQRAGQPVSSIHECNKVHDVLVSHTMTESAAFRVECRASWRLLHSSTIRMTDGFRQIQLAARASSPVSQASCPVINVHFVARHPSASWRSFIMARHHAKYVLRRQMRFRQAQFRQANVLAIQIIGGCVASASMMLCGQLLVRSALDMSQHSLQGRANEHPSEI